MILLLQILFLSGVLFSAKGQFEESSKNYIPDPQVLDFVYHNHDEMTNFLRYLFKSRILIKRLSNILAANIFYKFKYIP
jgi:hypothetical protein